jgi:hypothetical protein
MKVAHYHQENQAPKPFAVLKEHKDGTVDIGPEDGEPVVTKCQVVKEPKIGCVTFEKEKPAKEEKPKDDPKK